MIIKVINRSVFPLPQYATKASAGMDLRANLDEPLQLQPLERALIPTGLYMQLPEGYEAQVRPRSGLAISQGITCLNAPGTIDSDYRGEVKVILINLDQQAHSIQPGDRIAQLVVQPVVHAAWQEVEWLSESERGDGGFGHTGK
jgi:dUTP pyrophosphatase